MANSVLQTAHKNKKDEFYTSYADIEKELAFYQKHFAGKTVYCNCDDYRQSNFFRYFLLNFNKLKLKKLICTCYTDFETDVQLSFFEGNETAVGEERAYRIIVTEVKEPLLPTGNLQYLLGKTDRKIRHMKGDGDFRSNECIRLLKQADIIVTNPPFSLFREYINQLVKFKKKFLILGTINCVTYKNIFPLIQNHQIWLGATIHSGDREFRVPENYPARTNGFRIDKNGIHYIKVTGVRWFTNMEHGKIPEKLILKEKYRPEDYPLYENYPAVNTDRTDCIPYDYDGCIGVPITFLDKYNPAQFEIIRFKYGNDGKHFFYFRDGKKIEPYCRVIIRKLSTLK